MKKTIVERNLFGFSELSVPRQLPEFYSLLEESKEIVAKAIIENNPYAICLMLSGGDDSITALNVAILLGVKIDFIVHGVTGTGLPEVRTYVESIAAKTGIPILYADAKDAFERYVLRKGFFGRGVSAHSFAYHILKKDPFNAAISKHIRKGVPGRKIICLNGVRVEESDNRADNFGDNPYRWNKNDLWVNIIHWWDKVDCLKLLSELNFKRSPVSIALGRSGECNCGTMQTEADRILASEFNPAWGNWMLNLRKEVTRIHGWDIGTTPSKKAMKAIEEKVKNAPDFMPMCIGCKSKNLKLFPEE